MGYQVYIKREDLLHEFVSGNKFRKLKYNLLQAKAEKSPLLITFGGAYSNHIAATAYAAQSIGIPCIGIIRGEELQGAINSNPTLSFAQQHQMQFKFISRSDYRLKDTPEFLAQLKGEYGDFYLVPEGGTNALAIQGCNEILTPEDKFFDYICCAIGTGGTIAGISASAFTHQKVLGFPALKGDFFPEVIAELSPKANVEVITDYHFGGYAKIAEPLVEFINEFRWEYGIALDPVYTGKMAYGVWDMMAKAYFPSGSKILLIHTGGLQGIAGMNEKLSKLKLPLINV